MNSWIDDMANFPKKILLVQHYGSLESINSNTRAGILEPLSLEYLASAAKSHGHDVRVEVIGKNANEFQDIFRKYQPDIVGFSVYSYAIQNSIELARIVKKEERNGRQAPVTIFGGPHPTAYPEETISEESVDFVIIGEGERTFCDLLDKIEKSTDYKGVEGIAFTQNGKGIFTSPRTRIKDLDSLPYPKREERYLSQCKQYKIVYPPPSEQKSVAQVLYSRGCPFSCSFCASESIWKKQVVWRDPDCVCNELEELIRDYGTNLVFFPDLTFNANKTKVMDLCRALKARDLPLHWWAMFRLDLVDEEMLHALVEAKCMKLSFGIESPVDSLAKELKDQLSTRDGRRKDLLKYANELGLLLRAYLMIGLSDDTEEKLLSYSQHLLEYGFDDIRISFATPFPGTRFFKKLKQSGLLPEKIDWSKMTTEKPYLNHPVLSKEQLLKLHKEIILQFFTAKEYLEHVVDKTTRFPKLKQPWVEYLEFMNSNGVFRSRERSYASLIKSLSASS